MYLAQAGEGPSRALQLGQNRRKRDPPIVLDMEAVRLWAWLFSLFFLYRHTPILLVLGLLSVGGRPTFAIGAKKRHFPLQLALKELGFRGANGSPPRAAPRKGRNESPTC